MNIYYVYQYLREKDSKTASAGTPYYIGKGKGYRAYDKHTVTIPKDKSRIEIIAHKLFENEAHLLERKLISYYGRKDLGTGILINLTNGGDGPSGYKHTNEAKQKIAVAQKGKKKKPFSKEHRDKIGAKSKGRKFSEEAIQKMKNKVMSDTAKQKIAEFQKAKIVSKETKQKIREKARLNWKIRKEYLQVNKKTV